MLSEDTALMDVVRWIWRTFADTDWGVTTIARDLNRRGIPTPNGKKWSVETIEGILSNRVYTGANVFGRNRYGKYHHLGTTARRKRDPLSHPPGDPIVTDTIHDALIDQETFDRVKQKLQKRRQKHNRTRNSPYLLSGLLHCGHCGGIMAGRGYKVKDTYPHHYYTCTTAAGHPGACAYYQVPTAAIEDYVLGLVEKRLGGDEVVEQIRVASTEGPKKLRHTRRPPKVCGAALRRWTKRFNGEQRTCCWRTPTIWPIFRRCLATRPRERATLQDKLEREATAPRHDRGAAGRKSDCRTERPTGTPEDQRPSPSAGSS